MLPKKAARIKILDPQDYDPAIQWPQDIEKTLVHELLHLHFAPVDDSNSGLKLAMLEQAVESIASALIACDRR